MVPYTIYRIHNLHLNTQSSGCGGNTLKRARLGYLAVYLVKPFHAARGLIPFSPFLVKYAPKIKIFKINKNLYNTSKIYLPTNHGNLPKQNSSDFRKNAQGPLRRHHP